MKKHRVWGQRGPAPRDYWHIILSYFFVVIPFEWLKLEDWQLGPGGYWVDGCYPGACSHMGRGRVLLFVTYFCPKDVSERLWFAHRGAPPAPGLPPPWSGGSAAPSWWPTSCASTSAGRWNSPRRLGQGGPLPGPPTGLAPQPPPPSAFGEGLEGIAAPHRESCVLTTCMHIPHVRRCLLSERFAGFFHFCG